DCGYMRHFVVGARGAGWLIRFQDEGSTRSIQEVFDKERSNVWSLSSFDKPASVRAFTRADIPHKEFGKKEADDVKRDGFMTFQIRSHQLDHFNDDLVSQWRLGKVEDRTFKGAGGKDVQMFIVYPPDFDPKKKWPLVQMVHGGPHNAFHNEF